MEINLTEEQLLQRMVSLEIDLHEMIKELNYLKEQLNKLLCQTGTN